MLKLTENEKMMYGIMREITRTTAPKTFLRKLRKALF
jgi:hypothetical protein